MIAADLPMYGAMSPLCWPQNVVDATPQVPAAGFRASQRGLMSFWVYSTQSTTTYLIDPFSAADSYIWQKIDGTATVGDAMPRELGV